MISKLSELIKKNCLLSIAEEMACRLESRSIGKETKKLEYRKILHKLSKILVSTEYEDEIQRALLTMKDILELNLGTNEPMNIEDRKDLYELGRILLTNNEEEIQAALVAMKEILNEECDFDNPGNLVEALDIMDSKGRHSPEGNSMMLWNKDWSRLRAILFEIMTRIEEPMTLEDLYDLGKILLSDDEEEIQAALIAMKEILDNEPMILIPMDLEPTEYNPVPPVATILEFTGMSVGGLVACGCWPGITEAMASELANLTPYSAEFWLSLEKNYQKTLDSRNQ